MEAGRMEGAIARIRQFGGSGPLAAARPRVLLILGGGGPREAPAQRDQQRFWLRPQAPETGIMVEL